MDTNFKIQIIRLPLMLSSNNVQFLFGLYHVNFCVHINTKYISSNRHKRKKYIPKLYEMHVYIFVGLVEMVAPVKGLQHKVKGGYRQDSKKSNLWKFLSFSI